MKVVIFGASGIIGQHMRLFVPDGVEPIYCRREPDRLHVGVDLYDTKAVYDFLIEQRPDVIVNLAGENRTDVVEDDPVEHFFLNAHTPGWLTQYCDEYGSHLIHVSSQAVFSGEDPPYGPDSETQPINAYGRQKLEAEGQVREGLRWTIVRPTFVLGVRPLPFVGRGNPLEQMLSLDEQAQVADRWFSPLFARDAARELWAIVRERPKRAVIHLGNPVRTCRYEIAEAANPFAKVNPVQHDETFPLLARRPKDTTYAVGSRWEEEVELGLEICREEWTSRTLLDLHERAREIALFLGVPATPCVSRLAEGFGSLHAAVAQDFRASSPHSDDELLGWYRKTEAYIWELSAYHCDEGFNYTGLCEGVAERLRAAGGSHVLCLGDGIGDLTLSLRRAGFDAVYHDLSGSRTAEFAAFRYWMHTGEEMPRVLTDGWEPAIGGGYDAIVSLDFLEHVINVDEWAAAINAALRPDGIFFAQNAFAIGSGPDGSIPMHLTQNDRFEHDWLPLLASLGMKTESDNWFRRAA